MYDLCAGSHCRTRLCGQLVRCSWDTRMLGGRT
jgi:hypothetical protein